MKTQYQNFQKNLNGRYSNKEATAMQTQAAPLTEEDLNKDNRICYKKRREELNQRVKSVLEKRSKYQMPYTK